MELLTTGYRECKVQSWREGARGREADVGGIKFITRSKRRSNVVSHLAGGDGG